MIFPSITLDQMPFLAEKLTHALKPGVSICLWGDLGAGKSTLARLILQCLDPSLMEVPSPTFTLVQEYTTPKGNVWHCDFYRLKQPHEVVNLGMEEALYSEMCLIEWPEKIVEYLPENRLDVSLKINSDGTRDIRIVAQGSAKGTFHD